MTTLDCRGSQQLLGAHQQLHNRRVQVAQTPLGVLEMQRVSECEWATEPV